MNITIDIEDSTPVFSQLITQIKEAVISGDLKPGSALPSIRQLANDLDINKKTVSKAYQFLERDSVIETKGYRGTYIHPNAKKNSMIDLNEWVTNELTKLIVTFKESGVIDSEIRIAFNNLMHKRK
jgi:GntR family transcriptional regulator